MENKINLIQTKCFDFNVPKVNSTFGKVKILVASHEQIANGMKFTKEAMEKAMDSLNYIPIIGSYSEEKGDYTDHGQAMKITNESIEFEKNTKPIGVVIKDSGKFETIKAKNGEDMTYVTCEGYVWLQECPEAETIFKGDDNAQSMEINLTSYTTNDDWTYQVDEYEYTALCVLASDGSVKPAFHEAKVLTNFECDEFKARYSEMMIALDKFIKFQEEGGDTVENEEKVAEEVETPVEESEVKDVPETEEDTQESEDVKTIETDVTQENMEENEIDYKALYEDNQNKIFTMENQIIELQSKVDEFALKQEQDEKFSMINAYKGKIQDEKFAVFNENIDKFSKEELKAELLSAYVEALETKTVFTENKQVNIPTVDMFSSVTGEDVPESVKLIKKYSKQN